MKPWENPFSGHRYRLVTSDLGTWRITKSVIDHRHQVTLHHMKGRSSNDLDQGLSPEASIGADLNQAIDQLVRSRLILDQVVIADPKTTFRDVCLLDADRTFCLICAQIKSALIRFEQGSPGFRPGAPVLRREKDRLIQVALDMPVAFAGWWREGGYQAETVPEWLVEALATEVQKE
jgi:hypothetical protein